MRQPGGYAVATGPDGKVEQDTFTCGHCQHVVFVPAKADPAKIGGMCYQCMSLVCPRCVGLRTCEPFEKKLEALERSAIARRSYGF